MADNTTILTIAFLESQLEQAAEMQRELQERHNRISEHIQVLLNKLALLRGAQSEISNPTPTPSATQRSQSNA